MRDRQDAGRHYSESMMESRERPVGTRPLSSGDEPKSAGVKSSGNVADHIGSGDAGLSVPSTHIEAVTNLAKMFEGNTESLDLAIMQVIAEGGSPSKWIAGMLRASLPPELPEADPRPLFLGE